MPFLALVAPLACVYATDSPAGGDSPPAAPAGVVRLGTPTPTTGIYGLAYDPASARLYTANLHAPHVTVIDPATGAYAGGLDLRPQGIAMATLPQLVVGAGALWVTDFAAGRIARFSLPDQEPLSLLEPADGVSAIAVDADQVWIATGTEVARVDGDALVDGIPVRSGAQALDVQDDRVAVLYTDPAALEVYDRASGLLLSAALADTAVNDVLLHGDHVFYTDRASGDLVRVELDGTATRVHTGSDTYALARHEGLVLVTNRQGAELPASGAYEGDPGLVSAVDAETMAVRWVVEVGKTNHFLAYDGARWWTANEDSMDLSAIDPVAGVEVLRGPKVGLTLDHVAVDAGRVYFGSHLTDEVWVLDGDTARPLPTCGWPFVTLFSGGAGLVPCEEDGDVLRFDPDDPGQAEVVDAAPTAFPACPDGLCTRHDLLLDAALDAGTLVWTDALLPGLRWLDGGSLTLAMSSKLMPLAQHFGVVEVAGGLLVYQPRDRVLIRVEDRQFVAQRAFDSGADPLTTQQETGDFPLVADGDRAWIGHVALDAALTLVGDIGEGIVVAAQDGRLVVDAGDALRVVDGADGTVLASVDYAALRSPPFVDGDWKSPLRYRIDGDTLLVANTQVGTLERRAFPELEPVGDDTVVVAGPWE